MTSSRKPTRHSSFDLMAPLYDLGVWFLSLLAGGEKAFRSRVIDAAMPLEGMRVLEIFAGTATLALIAAERGADACVLDISRGMLRVAGEKAKKAGRNLARVQGASAEIPLKGMTFDRVVISLGLHEAAPPDLPQILSEAARVLKNRGRLVIFDFHRADGWAAPVQKVLFSFFEDEDAWTWLASDVQTMIREAGFVNFRRTFLNRGVFQLITAEKRG